METLEEELMILERSLNGGLLYDNYSGLTRGSGQVCQNLVVEYITLAESVLDNDIGFIKDLTKVADHIIKSGSLDDLLEKLYQFNMEGVQKIRDGIEGRTKNNLLLLESHLFTYAGDAARAKFDIIKDRNDVPIEEKILWAEKWYCAYKISADMTEDSNPKHSAHAYSFAGAAAQALFEKTQDISDAQNAIECYNKFLDYFDKNPNPRMGRIIRRIQSDVSFLEGEYRRYESIERLFEHI